MKRPSFVSTSADELATVIDGSYFADKKADFNLAFGQAKYIGALWMAYLARQYPNRRFITVSPGATTGTQASNGVALPLRVAAKYVMPALGISHKLEDGAKRLVDGVTDPNLSSGVFYASAANKLTRSLGEPSGHIPRSGQRVVSGPRQRSYPPLHPLKTLGLLGVFGCVPAFDNSSCGGLTTHQRTLGIPAGHWSECSWQVLRRAPSLISLPRIHRASPRSKIGAQVPGDTKERWRPAATTLRERGS